MQPAMRFPWVLISRCALIAAMVWAAFLSLGASPTFATSMMPLSDEQLVKASARVIEGNVVGTRSQWNAAHNQIHTTITIDVSRAYKGSMPANHRLVFDQVGGQVGDIVMDLTDQPSFTKGEHVIVFLRNPAEAVMTPVVGLSQGKLTVIPDPDTGVPMIRGRAISRDAFTRNLSRVVIEQEGSR